MRVEGFTKARVIRFSEITKYEKERGLQRRIEPRNKKRGPIHFYLACRVLGALEGWQATAAEDRLSLRRRNPHTLLPAVAEQSAPALLVAC